MNRFAKSSALQRRIARGVVCAAAVLCFSAAPASALTKIASGSLGQVAIDNGSVYWVVFNSSGSSTVMRRVLGSSVNSTVYTTPRRTFINALMAGGGRLAIETSRFKTTSEDTAVLTLSPDGAGAVTLATGLYGDTQREDCGTYVRLRDLAATGEVVVGNEQRKRQVAPCSNDANADAMVLTGHASDGGSRTLKTVTGAITKVSSFYDRFIFKAVLVGNRLLTTNEKATEVIDLTTGNISTYPRASSKHVISDADLDASGRVLLAQLYLRDRASNSRGTLALYGVVGDTVTHTSLRATRGYSTTGTFCGSKMLEQYGALDTLEQGNKLYQRTAAGTLMSLLYRSQPYSLISWRDCDGGTAVFAVSNDDTGTTRVYTVPLA